jgi:hypothetical protein
LSNDSITPAELQALLGTDELKVAESETISGAKPVLVNPVQEPVQEPMQEPVQEPVPQKESALESEQIIELRNIINELADRVTQLELLLAGEIEARLQWSAEQQAAREAAQLEAESLNHPEPGTFSRSESYGKKTKKKKKKSLWRKLID